MVEVSLGLGTPRPGHDKGGLAAERQDFKMEVYSTGVHCDFEMSIEWRDSILPFNLKGMVEDGSVGGHSSRQIGLGTAARQEWKYVRITTHGMITFTNTLTLQVMQSTLRTAPCEDGPPQNDRH